MLLNINGIGNQKIKYKNHKDLEFDGLDSYILLAKKSISKFSNKFYNGLAAKMLKDEDAISSVANAIMMADWRWDADYQNDKGTKKTKYSYRNQCALWAIQTYISKNHKSKKPKNVLSLDHIIDTDSEISVSNLTEDCRVRSPEEIVIEKESKEEIKHLIDSMLNLNWLSARQCEYIRLYYFESYTFDKIGKKYGITREAVRQGLNKAIQTIREFVST